MGEATGIKWCDHTFNPWIGCSRVSPACDHCYAEAMAKRTGKAKWGDEAVRVPTSAGYWLNPARWERKAAAGEPGPNTGRADHLVFCASMADVFEDREDVHDLRQVLLEEIVPAAPHMTWLLLTKRPENVLDMVPESWLPEHVDPWPFSGWPHNVWVGTTVEDQERAEERIPHLLKVPAPVRFLSVEPMLGPVDLSLGYPFDRNGIDLDHGPEWVICGGESGAGHRSLNLDHARALRDQCAAARIPFFFKQVGGQFPTSGGDQLDGVVIKEFPPERAIHIAKEQARA